MRAKVLAAIAGAGGVGVATLWLHGYVRLPVVLILAVAAAGWCLDAAGRNIALPARPDIAVRLMNGYVLLPIAAAALTGAVVLVIGVVAEPDKTAPVATQKLLAGIAGVLSGFLTAVFISALDDADEKIIGTRVHDAFVRAYDTRFAVNTPGADALFSDYAGGELRGWGREARAARASTIRTALLTRPATPKAP